MLSSSVFHTGCKPEQQMMYAGSKNRLVQTAELTKVWGRPKLLSVREESLRSEG